MQPLTLFAIYFLFWWITLFGVLPVGLRTQEEENSIVPGTARSAPARFRVFWIFVGTTVISALLFAAFYVVTVTFGWNVDALPQLYPDFEKPSNG